MMILPILWGLESWCWPDKWCSDATVACQRFRWWFLGVSFTLRLWVFCPSAFISPLPLTRWADLWSYFPSPGRPLRNICLQESLGLHPVSFMDLWQSEIMLFVYWLIVFLLLLEHPYHEGGAFSALYFQCLKDPYTECLLITSSLNEEGSHLPYLATNFFLLL